MIKRLTSILVFLFIISCSTTTDTIRGNQSISSDSLVSVGCVNALDFSSNSFTIYSTDIIHQQVIGGDTQSYTLSGSFSKASTIIQNNMLSAPISEVNEGDGSYVGGNFVSYNLDGSEIKIGALRDNSDQNIEVIETWVSLVFDQLSREIPPVREFLSSYCGI